MSTGTNPNLPLIPTASAALENKNFAFPQLKNIPSDLSLPMLKVFSYGGPGDVQGVPSTLEVLVKRLGTDVHWFSVESQEKEATTSSAALRNLSFSIYETKNASAGFTFHGAKLSKDIIEKHKRVCTNYLWPLFHAMPEHARFNLEDWRAYKQVCQELAAQSQSVTGTSFPSISWIHDFQFALSAPSMSFEHGVVVCQFWHIPWPDAKLIADSRVGVEIVQSLLANTLLGFHTLEYAVNFMDTVAFLFPDAELDCEKLQVRYKGHTTRLKVLPLGLDLDRWQKLAMKARPKAESLAVQHRLSNFIMLGVDRLDYSKGVLEKLLGLEYFLEDNKEYLRRFHYVQVTQSPQSDDISYRSYSQAVKDKIAEINSKFEVDGWKPILHLDGLMSQEDLAAWYQAASVMAVNSIKDGLNLIAKEFVSCRLDQQGVLILSKEAGCANELKSGAVIVDPSNPREFAKALSFSFSMSVEEKRRRIGSMRHALGWNQLHDWALNFLSEAID